MYEICSIWTKDDTECSGDDSFTDVEAFFDDGTGGFKSARRKQQVH